MARFMRKGVTKFFFVPTISSATLAAVTAAEVVAGDDLTPELAEVTGFSFTNQPIDVPDMDDAFTGNIGGEDKVEDSSMTFYEDDTTNDLMTTLAKGESGFVVIFPEGIADVDGTTPAAGDVCDVWPAVITSNARQYTAANEAAKWLVKIGPWEKPAFDITLT